MHTHSLYVAYKITDVRSRRQGRKKVVDKHTYLALVSRRCTRKWSEILSKDEESRKTVISVKAAVSLAPMNKEGHVTKKTPHISSNSDSSRRSSTSTGMYVLSRVV